MRYREVLCVAGLCTLISCGPSTKEELRREQTIPPQSPILTDGQTAPSPKESVPPTETTRKWNPKFISTGDASGIMVQFIGLKKNAQLNARYAFIELRRLPENLPAAQSSTPVGYLENRPPAEIPKISEGDPTILRSTINDLRQAFFNVPPGKYSFRQAKEWADRSIVMNLEVREGHYSVIRVDVFNAWSTKLKQLSESYEGK